MQKAVFLLCAATVVLPAQPFTTVASFSGSNGANPQVALIQGTDGDFYGTTDWGGAYNHGTVFRVTPTGEVTALHNFAFTDGGSPLGTLIQATDGNFYGTTNTGGANNYGTIFRITPTGTLTTLYNFCAQSNCIDGQNPVAGLIQASDGNLYGTASGGGPNGVGTIFEITLSGAFSTLHNFNGTDGMTPYGGLVQSTDGDLYGTTAWGGTGSGTAYKVTLAGVLTTLHIFNSTDGVRPYATLIQANDGNFYGTTELGGSNNFGTIFKVTPAGAFTSLYGFAGPEGQQPYCGLIQATDGNLYGTAANGGANGYGSIFKMTLAGVLTTVHSFASTDGANPYGALMKAADRSLYGTTSEGGLSGAGTVFRLTLANPFQAPLVTTGAASAVTTNAATLAGSVNPNGVDTHVWFAYGISSSLSVSTLTPQQDAGSGTSAVPISANITGLNPSTTYYFLVWGQNSGGTSQGSVMSFTTTGASTGYDIAGEITLAGNALPDVTVTVSGPGNNSAATNSLGLYGVEVAAGGNYTLTPSLSGYTFSPASATFNNVSSNQTQNFTAAVASGGPVITSAGVVNGASFQAGIVPDSWLTIYGTSLSSTTDTWTDAVINGNLPQALDGVRVIVGGEPAYISYVSPGQINGLAPNISPGNVSVTVTNSNLTSAPVTVAAQMVQPAFFQWGTYAVATRTDYSWAVKNGFFPGVTTVPAQPGDTIILWGTGFGPTTPAAPTGIIVPSNATYLTANTVTATVGGLAANVYGGAGALTPGEAGLYQVAIQIPATLADGDYPVIATISGAQSPSNVLITVQK
jgi:uncharacterized protein (TIGR03437 family)